MNWPLHKRPSLSLTNLFKILRGTFSPSKISNRVKITTACTAITQAISYIHLCQSRLGEIFLTRSTERSILVIKLPMQESAKSQRCLHCQAFKITKHVKNRPSSCVAPDGRFKHVYINIGLLSIIKDFSYFLTIVDRFSWFIEAVPMRDMTATNVTRLFIDTWVARFGTPEYLMSDQGSQFKSQLFQALLLLLGTKRIRTVAYHPVQWHD